MNPKLHDLALRDYRVHFEYLQNANVSEKTLGKYLDEIEAAGQRIADNPTTWSFTPGSKRVRRVQVAAFRLQIFYVITPQGVPFILEIAGPGARPRWRGRLGDAAWE
jgi:plasmid stabilization system protein ParE